MMSQNKHTQDIITTGCAGLGPDGGWRLRPRLCATASFFSTDAPPSYRAFGRLVNGERAFHRRRAVAAARDERRLRERRAGVHTRARAARAVGEPRRPSAARRAALASASEASSAARHSSSLVAAGHAAGQRQGIYGSEGIYRSSGGARAWPPGACAAFDEDRGPHDEACTRRSSTS